MDYWLGYAKDYAVGIGLRLDENATDSWDTPIRCSSKTEDVLAAYIRDDRHIIRTRKAAPPSGSGQNRSETDSTNCSSVADNGSHIREKGSHGGPFSYVKI